MPNLLDPAFRVQILKDIQSEDNRARKREHQKRFDVYRDRQDRYILERLEREFDVDTVNDMRKIFSINLSKRIVDEMSSIYNSPPDRQWSQEDGEPGDAEMKQLDNLYEDSMVDKAMLKANKFYNLHDQCALMCVPDKEGGLKVKAIPPMHYDVVPDSMNPERAAAYILNVWDYDLHKTARDNTSEKTQLNRYQANDRLNQSIADVNDRKALLERYIVWTNEFHYIMDGKGNILDEVIENPIQMMPFVDIADDKDFEFFVRYGSNITAFALDFGMVLSDLANTIRLQNYSQAVISSDKQPTNVRVGPQEILWLQKDPNNPGFDPKFEFVSPSPDLAGSLEFLEQLIRLFLSSRGIDPMTISGKSSGRTFGSGVERLLAMLDKFEATRSDFDLFKNAEIQLFNIIRAWSNVLQNTTGEAQLKPELQLSTISEETFIEIKFSEPMAVMTQAERETSVKGLVESGFMSRVEAIMKLREVSEDKAIEILKQIDEEDQMLRTEMNQEGRQIDGEVNEGSNESIEREQSETEVESEGDVRG
jgi:hypothetical protein